MALDSWTAGEEPHGVAVRRRKTSSSARAWWVAGGPVH